MESKSGIVFPDWKPQTFAIEATLHETLQIHKVDTDAPKAKKLADEEYSQFFDKWHPYIKRSTHHILNEIHTAEGLIGYLIRTDIEAPESTMHEIKLWVTEHLKSDRER